MKEVKKAVKEVLSDPFYFVLTLSLSFNLLLVYYFIFLQSTTLSIFWSSNTLFYNIVSIFLNLLISFLFGLSVALLLYQWKERKQKEVITSAGGLTGAFLGAISTGCPVCGAYLLSVLGIAGGLSAFPFQGLELKVLALALLSYSIKTTSREILNEKCKQCKPQESFQVKIKKGDIILSLPDSKVKLLKTAGIIVGSLIIVFYLPLIAEKLGISFSFQNNQSSSSFSAKEQEAFKESGKYSNLISQVLPEEGYTINAVYGDLGPKLLASGAIDLEKFKQVYQRAGRPLTKEELEILTKGSNKKITINKDNAYFLLNFLWALGLTNKNPILEKGPLMKYGGKSNIGYFASTGGWTLGKKSATQLYSSAEIINLNSQEQKELEKFAYNSYRPCCNNSTAFADCNHGMAALALGEILASQGAKADEMFEALKYFNSFWFPQQYLDLANYFKLKEGKNWDEVDAKVVLSKDYSTASGWSRVRNWLAQQGAIERAGLGGGGCGV